MVPHGFDLKWHHARASFYLFFLLANALRSGNTTDVQSQKLVSLFSDPLRDSFVPILYGELVAHKSIPFTIIFPIPLENR
jgi:hypothetical protein